jgi:hypothetical protein
MTKLEKSKIVDFIDSIMENDYSRANKNLNVVIQEKIKSKIGKAKHVKAFGEEKDCGCEDSDNQKAKNKKGKN